MSAISFKGEIILAAGQGAGLLNDIWKSKDGRNWIQVHTSMNKSREAFCAAEFNNNLIIYGGINGRNILGDVLK